MDKMTAAQASLELPWGPGTLVQSQEAGIFLSCYLPWVQEVMGDAHQSPLWSGPSCR